ncbi:MAPEG family protein [Vannielia litorea]|uniref:MAPEG family protein n=1 Tax=Vannielia litorea TaxID=1217970 RepID=UPI001BCEC43B|nr:MAPEG family protein [Vannielia litorea]MBS8228208.1 glutathione metabolism protein [Vannielia litorea]
MFPVTSIYAGLLTLLYIGLSAGVIRRRRAAGISVGDGDDARMRVLTRAHANCAEYVPVGVLLLALSEGQGAPAVALHLMGVTLLVGRVLHARAFLGARINLRLRVLGMALTFLPLLLMAVGLPLHALF